MVVADANTSLQITGTGDVLDPHDGVVGACSRPSYVSVRAAPLTQGTCRRVWPAIGSGGTYALAAARALLDIPGMDALAIAKKAMTIAADTCIYTKCVGRLKMACMRAALLLRHSRAALHPHSQPQLHD